MRYIRLGTGNRVIAHTDAPSNPDPSIWHQFTLPDERLEDFNDYKLVGGQLVYDPREYTPEELDEMARGEIMATIPEIVSDTDAAICELYEMQEQALADTDAALCEIYEMLIGE